jgi:aspartyl-tRNA(Asn)/glutamyl-tRNA(Gln) amidotransferase subunit A
MSELHHLTMHALGDLLRARKVSAAEITAAVYRRIDAVEGSINAYITLARDQAMRQARRADELLGRGGGTAVTGIPLAVKDNLCTRGIRTTCGSKMLAAFIPPYDATVISALKSQQAVLIGKTGMDEFAMGSSNENSYWGSVRNPWDIARVPGGSSGGSAAAVAADACIAAVGSDTGGSIRQPASFCGVVGLKPTYGRVSRYGLIACASSLDQIGPITKDVHDAAVLLTHISGYDARDATSAALPAPDYAAGLGGSIKGLRIGIPKEYFVDGLDPEVERAVREALGEIEKLGATLCDISLPHTEYAVAAYYLIATAEASSNLARYDGVTYGYRARGCKSIGDMYARTRTEGFGPEVKRRIMLGTYALSAGYCDAYYTKASRVRTLIGQDMHNAFNECDLIVTPTAPTPAFKLGEKIHDPLSMYLSDLFTLPASLAGLPAVSLPCGRSREGLPVGLQILGNHFCEDRILRCAYRFEQHTSWHTARPALTTA